jgi:hypothetical protein
VSRSIASQSGGLDELARLGDLVGRVAGLEVAHGAVEQGRRQRHVTRLRDTIADRADVVIHPEDLLNHHDAAPGLAARVGPIGAKLVAVGCNKCKWHSHRDLLAAAVTVTLRGISPRKTPLAAGALGYQRS